MRVCNLLRKAGQFLLIGLALLGSIHSRLAAQANTLVSVQPGSSSIAIDSSITVMIQVDNGTSLNAYDLTLTYDPAVVILESWSHGTYFSNIAVVKQVNQPGLLRLAATQLGADPVNGDGILLNLKFKGIEAGSTEVEFTEVKFASSTSELVYPVLQNGSITVSGELQPSITSSPTMTTTTAPSLTIAPSITASRTPSPSITITRSQTKTKTAAIQNTSSGTTTQAATRAQATEEAAAGTANLTLVPAGSTASPIAGTSLAPQPVLTQMPVMPSQTAITAAVKAPDKDQAELNRVLWALAVLLAGLLAVMVLLIIFRRNKEQDN
ncbi:MAG TPA: cohesin domain-containing protein [Anaerolineaceae bacterium]|nr:cohesin domain-containing protein [Anaerolineaceae bacterium]